MNAITPINRPDTNSDELANEKLRAQALAAKLICELDAAAACTDHPVALGMIAHYRGKVRTRLRWMDENIYSASHALGMLGPNGYGPAIADACRVARHHGFDWQARRDALMDSITVLGRIAPFARALSDGGVA